MVSPITTAKIFSVLGNNSSLIPLGIKDTFSIIGMTTGAYITGKETEGKDRFIDEIGGLSIWLLGIPFFKKIIDKTIYKIAKLNPDIDVRILKNNKIFEKAKNHALPAIKEGFEKIEKNQKLFKNLSLVKFGLATALTFGSYFALTVFRHKHTEKSIIKEIKKEENLKKAKQETGKNTFKNPSFGLNLEPLKQFMFDPVKNTMIIDGGISSQRLSESRNPQDFIGYAIKEGGFWAFMYFLGPFIQNKLEEKAAKNHRPIDLDIRVLQDEVFQKSIKDGSIKNHLDELSKYMEKYEQTIAKKGDSKEILKAKEKIRMELEPEIYESLFKNGTNDISENLIVQMAKKSDIIKTIKNSNAIDTQNYIDIGKIVGTKEKIENIFKEFKNSNEGIENFFKQVLKLKKMSIIKNIGSSICALGILVPGIMLAARLLNKDNKEFHVKKQIYEKLKKENSIN